MDYIYIVLKRLIQYNSHMFLYVFRTINFLGPLVIIIRFYL